MSKHLTRPNCLKVLTACGLLLLLVFTSGCGPAQPPTVGAKPRVIKTTNAETVLDPSLSIQYASVFEDLPPARGKDPFFPNSHRREPAAEAPMVGNVRINPSLTLKGIVGSLTHRLAVINNEILETGEESRVRVPNGHVRVKCIKIGDNYVVVKVEGEAEPKTLSMEQQRN